MGKSLQGNHGRHDHQRCDEPNNRPADRAGRQPQPPANQRDQNRDRDDGEGLDFDYQAVDLPPWDQVGLVDREHRDGDAERRGDKTPEAGQDSREQPLCDTSRHALPPRLAKSSRIMMFHRPERLDFQL